MVCSDRYTRTNCDQCLLNFTGSNCDQCLPDYYGPTCSVFCQPEPDQYLCSTSPPHRVCIGNFAGPDCEQCETNYYRPSTKCQTFCEPTTTTRCDSNGSPVSRYTHNRACSIHIQHVCLIKGLQEKSCRMNFI